MSIKRGQYFSPRNLWKCFLTRAVKLDSELNKHSTASSTN